MEPLQISININLDGLRGELQRSLQRAIYLVACGLQATEQITGDILKLPDEAFQMIYTNQLKWSDAEARSRIYGMGSIKRLPRSNRKCVQFLGVWA